MFKDMVRDSLVAKLSSFVAAPPPRPHPDVSVFVVGSGSDDAVVTHLPLKGGKVASVLH